MLRGLLQILMVAHQYSATFFNIQQMAPAGLTALLIPLSARIQSPDLLMELNTPFEFMPKIRRVFPQQTNLQLGRRLLVHPSHKLQQSQKLIRRAQP
jgi:hypothetical protein